jgi:hypothetical protein
MDMTILTIPLARVASPKKRGRIFCTRNIPTPDRFTQMISADVRSRAFVPMAGKPDPKSTRAATNGTTATAWLLRRPADGASSGRDLGVARHATHTPRKRLALRERLRCAWHAHLHDLATEARAQCGLSILPEGELVGPGTFAVAQDGKIYILDRVQTKRQNLRSQRAFEVSVADIPTAARK